MRNRGRSPGTGPSSTSYFAGFALVAVASSLSPSLLNAQLPVGGEFQVNAYTTGLQVETRASSDADGDLVVVWVGVNQDGSSSGLFGRRFSSAGTALGGEFQVNTYTASYQEDPSVASGGAGDFIVAWTSRYQDGSARGVFARRFSSAAVALANEFQVNTYTEDYQYFPSVAADGDGDFVIAWQGKAGSAVDVFARRFSSAGVALATELQLTDGGLQSRPSVASESDGDFVVAWLGPLTGSIGGVFGRRFSSAGVALTSELQVSTYTAGFRNPPSAAIDDEGDFVIVWSSYGQDGAFTGTFARRFSSAGVALVPEFQVSAYTIYGESYPDVTSDADGDFVVAWSAYRPGAATQVLARRFSSSGAAQATEFVVNTYTAGPQDRPTVTSDASGDFVVAWASQYQDGDDQGIFAQRFAAPKILDIDGNGVVGPLSDGLLVLRFLFGFTGASLTDGAVAPGCTRCDGAAIEPYLQSMV